jgi:hypothetical protein
MKKFEIITEADARVLARGETVELTRGGHITPLAADTLKERRITVVRDGQVSAADAALAPPADVRTVAIASDHGGVALRKTLVDVSPRPGACRSRSRHRWARPGRLS